MRKANYVDGSHPCIHERDGLDKAHRSCAQLKPGMNSWGKQAANRKYRSQTATLSAWSGVIIHTDTLFPMMSTTEKKWAHFKDGISWILSEGRATAFLLTAELRKIAGLGVNAVWTPAI